MISIYLCQLYEYKKRVFFKIIGIQSYIGFTQHNTSVFSLRQGENRFWSRKSPGDKPSVSSACSHPTWNWWLSEFEEVLFTPNMNNDSSWVSRIPFIFSLTMNFWELLPHCFFHSVWWFICIVCINSTFLLLNSIPLYGYDIICLSTSPVDGLLGCFQFLAITEKLLSTLVYNERMFSFILGKYLLVEWLEHIIFLCNILRNQETIFQSGCAILHFYQQCIRVLVPLYLWQRLA